VRNFASFKKLLVAAPDAAVAYLTLGAANYIIGRLPGTKKFFLGEANWSHNEIESHHVWILRLGGRLYTGYERTPSGKPH